MYSTTDVSVMIGGQNTQPLDKRPNDGGGAQRSGEDRRSVPSPRLLEEDFKDPFELELEGARRLAQARGGECVGQIVRVMDL